MEILITLHGISEYKMHNRVITLSLHCKVVDATCNAFSNVQEQAVKKVGSVYLHQQQ